MGQHLRAWNAYSGDTTPCSFGARRAVDFGNLEVKNTRTIRLSDLNSLRAFKQDYPEAEVCLLYRGDERIEIQGIRCLP